MPVPGILFDRFTDPAFWQRFFFEEENGAPVPDAVVEFEVGGGCQVVLDVKGRFDSYELGIRTPDSGGIRSVGWDDEAHWHPYAFRWSELDLVCRAVAVLDPLLPHPGPPLVLLSRFVSVHDDDDVDQITATLTAAFEYLRPPGWRGYWPDAATWLSRRDFRGRGVSWTRDLSGNLYATQEDDDELPFYSMRSVPSDDPAGFPYDAWRSLLTAAKVTVGR